LPYNTIEREIVIEHVRPIPEADQIANRFFSARENAVFRALPPSHKPRRFQLLDAQEAYVKVRTG